MRSIIYPLTLTKPKAEYFQFEGIPPISLISIKKGNSFFISVSSYYKVVVFIDPLQGLYAILLEMLWIVFCFLPLDGFRKATITVSLYIC